MWREIPRGSGTMNGPVHSSSGRCQGSVTRAGSGVVATIRKAIAPSFHGGTSVAGFVQSAIFVGREPGWALMPLPLHIVGVAEHAGPHAQTSAPDTSRQPT